METKFKAIDEMCKGKSFIFENKTNKINNYEQFKKYLQKINDKAANIYSNYDFYQNYENENCKFMPIFDDKLKFCFETINGSIIHTKELEIKSESMNKTEFINNVFILNKEKNKYCFEIKLGHGTWDNLKFLKNDLNIYNNLDKYRNVFKIGLLKVKEQNLNTLNRNLFYIDETISFSNLSDKKSNYEINLLEESEKEELIENYENYKNSIYYSFDLNNIIKNSSNNSKNNKNTNSTIETIGKNDIIGIVVDKSSINAFLQLKIFINGELVQSELIPNVLEENSETYFNIEDEYNNEKHESYSQNLLIFFIELGPNNSIFIKDKSNDEKITSNEKMLYYDLYKAPSLNEFPPKIIVEQNMTDYYLEILNKVGTKIINLYPNIFEELEFKKIIRFFENIIFKNKTILKNKILPFLSQDLTPNDMESFKEKLTTLFLIIFHSANSIIEKNKLIKLIIELLIENISEKNFNFIDLILNPCNKSENIIFELIKFRFTLCFLLFDGFMNEKDFIKLMVNNLGESLLNQYEFFINFCYCLFNNIFYIESFNAYNLIKDNNSYNNKINPKNYILFNFKDSKDKTNLISDYSVQYFEFIVEDIIIKRFLLEKEKYQNFIQFIFLNSKSNDNFCLINGIIRALIQYFKTNDKICIINTSESIQKLLFVNYLESKNNYFPNTTDSFYGKIPNNQLIPSVFKNIKNYFDKETNQQEKNIYLAFRIVIIFISKYYKQFSNLEIKANNLINNFDNNKIKYLNELSNSEEFYQVFFSYHTYDKLLFYFYYLSEILIYSIKT